MTPPATHAVVSLFLLALTFVGANAQNLAASKHDAPPFHDYKGVRIGMTANDARKVLGKPVDTSDTEDFYTVSDHETAQLYYDSNHKVFAIAVTYLGPTAPEPKSVLLTDADRKNDGSLYKLIRFPKAGYWVSYMRTAGDSPTTKVTIQKIQ